MILLEINKHKDIPDGRKHFMIALHDVYVLLKIFYKGI